MPDALETLVADMRTELAMVLGKNLVGIYLYGSLTQAAFNPKRSDVDAIVVTTRALTTREFRAVGRWLRRSAGAICASCICGCLLVSPRPWKSRVTVMARSTVSRLHYWRTAQEKDAHRQLMWLYDRLIIQK